MKRWYQGNQLLITFIIMLLSTLNRRSGTKFLKISSAILNAVDSQKSLRESMFNFKVNTVSANI